MVPWSVSERNKRPKLTSKPHTNLKICAPEAKFVKESDFDVKSGVAPPKFTEHDEKRISEPEKFVEHFFQRRNIESCKSSETRVAEVSRRSERSSRGKRTFEVCRRCRQFFRGVTSLLNLMDRNKRHTST